MPVLGVGGSQTYQMPAFKEFRVSDDNHGRLSPDTLKVIENETREIADKSKSDELRGMKPGNSDGEKVIGYLKAIVARMGAEELPDKVADLPLAERQEKFEDMFRTRSAEMLKAIEKKSDKIDNAVFKNMLDAVIEFRASLDRSYKLMKGGTKPAIIDSIWSGNWGRKLGRLTMELRQKPPRAESPGEEPGGRPKAGIFDPNPVSKPLRRAERTKARIFDPNPVPKPPRRGGKPEIPPKPAGLKPTRQTGGGAPGKT